MPKKKELNLRQNSGIKNIENQEHPFYKFLDHENKALEVKSKQIKLDEEVVKASDRDSERHYNYNIKRLENEQENTRANRKTKNMIIILLACITFMILIFSGYLIIKQNPLGTKLLTHLLALLTGALGGSGGTLYYSFKK